MEGSPTGERSASNSPEGEGVYKARKLDFVEHLVSSLNIFGYVVIVLQYIKFEPSFWIMALRISAHGILSNPFPSDLRLRRYAQRNPQSSAITPGIVMPGGFDTIINGTNSNTADESTPSSTPESEDSIILDFKKKIRVLLFHASLTLNVVIFLWNILHPTHFMAKFEGEYLDEPGLKNTPSPFVSGNGVVVGEMRGRQFLQIIGELVPQSDLWANLHKSLYDLLILLVEFTLFSITCVIYGDLGYKEPEDDGWKVSDGYDGNVKVIEIDYDRVIRVVTQQEDEEGAPSDEGLV